MARGPLGVRRPLASCDIALMYRITGIPREEQRFITFNSLETDLRDNAPVRVKDVFIETGKQRLNANTAKIAVVLDPIRGDPPSLGSLNKDDETIRGYINDYEELGRIEFVQVVCGDPEQQVRV